MFDQLTNDVTEELKDRYLSESQTHRQQYPDWGAPSITLLLARNAIRGEVGGSLGKIYTLELTPRWKDPDTVKYSVTVVQKRGERAIPADVNAIAGYCGLKVHVKQDANVDRDELDEDEDIPRLTYELIR